MIVLNRYFEVKTTLGKDSTADMNTKILLARSYKLFFFFFNAVTVIVVRLFLRFEL